MSFPPGETLSFDMEWEHVFWDATETLYLERTDRYSNEFASAVADDHGSVTQYEAPQHEYRLRLINSFSEMQHQSHPSKAKRRRNRKDKEWHAIGIILKARKAAGKDSDVYLDKQLIDPRKLQKNTCRPRFMQPFEKYGNTPIPPVPRDFEIRTPQLQDDVPTWTQELPFMQFRSRFQQEASRKYPSNLFRPSSDSVLHQTVSMMHSQIVMPKLEALLLASMFHTYTAGASEAGLRVERASRAYFDLLSFSLANNFAGLDGLPPHHALEYLKSQSITHIARLMQSISGQTGRALAEKLFICAIEAKDTSVVEMILRYNQNTKIDANKSVCKYAGVAYTPIERSAGLRDIETVRILLEYGADTNKTLPRELFLQGTPGWRAGALSCALFWDTSEKTAVEFELVQLLLKHGACVKPYHLEESLGRQSAEVVHVLFQAGALENHKEWEKCGLFGQVVQVLDDEAATRSINLLKQVGADINAPQNREYPTMLDVAAERGNIEMVLILRRFGAIETETTLSYAIKSRNRAIVDLFLKGGKVDGLSCRPPRTTPYAEAVRMGDQTLMETLEQKGAWTNIKEINRYTAALDAASEVGNAQVIRRLLKTSQEMLKDNRLDDALRRALSTAVELNDKKIAIMLIHSGAKGFAHLLSSPTPLQKALEHRNREIVRAILDFETATLRSTNQSLVLAAKWGDISIIEDLLVSGCDINWKSDNGETPLIVAIEKQDWELVRFCLNVGSDVKEMYVNGKRNSYTALSTAVEIQDIDMVNYLLSEGADPGDPAALFRACEKGGDALGLLLDEFLKRYPNGKKGYLDFALVHAVQTDDISILESLRPVMALKFPGYSHHVSELIGTRLIASTKASLRAVQILLDAGANPNTVVWSEYRVERLPLISAAIKAMNVQMVQLLLDKGADVNFPATRGVRFTPIQAAAKTGRYEIILRLINRGADVDAPAAEVGGGTAIQLAAIGGFLGIVELLLKKGANINRAPSILHGRSALEGAAEWGRLDMVQFLLRSGAQIHGGGRKPFLNAMKLAEENGHFVVLELLQSYSQ